MTTPTTLRALDGHLCRLAEDLNKPTTPEQAKRQIEGEIGRLMAARPALIERTRRQSVSRSPFGGES